MSKEQRDDLVSSQGHSMTWKRYHRYGGMTTTQTWKFCYFRYLDIIPPSIHVSTFEIIYCGNLGESSSRQSKVCHHNSFPLNFSNKGNFQRKSDPLVPTSPSTVLNSPLTIPAFLLTVSQPISPHYSPLLYRIIIFLLDEYYKTSRALRFITFINL